MYLRAVLGFLRRRAHVDGVPLELDPQTIALMNRVKAAFDPEGLLNPGKIFPD